MKPQLSIITPSFNQGIFLERTIQSVLSQEICDLEYLVFDGGSSDNSVDILKKYQAHLSFVSESDEGQSDAVNKGLHHAKGNIIGWLNSDDVYYPNTFKTVLDIFENNPTIDVIYGRADHIDEYDNYMEDYYTETWDYEKLKNVCFICQPAVFFRKSIVERFGVLNKELRYCMDYEYWLRIGREVPFYFLDFKLAGSRLYSNNKTLGNRKAVHEEIIKMLKYKFKMVPSKWIFNLAHILVEEAGIQRNSPHDNYIFVKKVIWESSKIFLKCEKKIPYEDIKLMAGWLKHAKKNMLETINHENRL